MPTSTELLSSSLYSANISAILDGSALDGANLLAYWLFEGNSVDHTTNDHDGTDTTITYSTANGKFSQGAGFNGTSSKIALTRFTIGAACSVAAWIKTTANVAKGTYNTGNPIIGDTNGGVYNSFGITSGKVSYCYYDTTWKTVDGVTPVNDGLWHHVVIVDNGDNTCTLYVDGALDKGPTACKSYAATSTNIIGGGYGAEKWWNGALDEVAIFNKALSAAEVASIYNSLSVYYRFSSGALTLDTAHANALTTITDPYNKALLHFDGSDTSTTFTDVLGKTWTARGNAQLDTAQKKFGTASLLLDGTGDWIDTPDHADWIFGDADFTIDFWVRWATLPTAGNGQGLWGQNVDGYHRTSLWLYHRTSPNQYELFADFWSDTTTYMEIASTTWQPSTNTWYHIALVRYGNVWTLYADGTAIATTTKAYTVPNLAAVFQVGADGTLVLNGWIDEFRVSKGIARWTTTFTPPSTAYINGPTESTDSVFTGAVNTGPIEAGFYSAIDNPSLRPLGNFSVGAWFKTTAGGWRTIFASSDYKSAKWAGVVFLMYAGHISMLSAKNTGTTPGTDYMDVWSTNHYNDGAWHFAVATWDGTHIKLYIDGAQEGGDVDWTYAPVYPSPNYVRVGCDYETNSAANINYWEGLLDEVFLFNGKALTLAEVRSLYCTDNLKTLTESMTATSTITRDVGKLLSSAITFAETLLKGTSRLFTDSVSITESLLKGSSRLFTDSVSITESLLRGTGKLLSEAISLTETFLKGIARTFTESMVVSSVIEALKVISVVFTDSVVFVENITKDVGKVVVDVVNITENLSRGIVRAFTDVVNYVDTATKGAGKFFLDAVDVTDSWLRGLGKLFIENITLTEDFSKGIARIFADAVSYSETIIKGAGKFFLDAVNVTDSWLRGFGKIFIENITFTETFEKLKIIVREFIENISITETIERIFDKFYGVFGWGKMSSQEDKVASLQTEVKPTIGDNTKQSFMSSSEDTPTGTIVEGSKPSL